MQSPERIIKCYDDVAANYAAELRDELSKKHLDRILLREFAATNKHRGPMADFGCGPGQTTQFLCDHGATDITGIDLSPGMIRMARRLFPELNFETGNLLDLQYPAGYFGSAVAFYAVVHFDYPEMEKALQQVNHVLKNGGQFLFSFHTGEEIVHCDTFMGKEVDIDFYLFQTGKVMELLVKSGFKVIDALERNPYDNVEYPSKRAYIWVEKMAAI